MSHRSHASRSRCVSAHRPAELLMFKILIAKRGVFAAGKARQMTRAFDSARGD